jgi:hypothetical protein
MFSCTGQRQLAKEAKNGLRTPQKYQEKFNLEHKHVIPQITGSTLRQTKMYEFGNVDWSELAGKGTFLLSLVVAVHYNKEFRDEVDNNNRHVHDLVACT